MSDLYKIIRYYQRFHLATFNYCIHGREYEVTLYNYLTAVVNRYERFRVYLRCSRVVMRRLRFFMQARDINNIAYKRIDIAY